MSKKLIAVAAAAALALTALVGIAPANATVEVTFGTNDAAGTGITAFTPSASSAAAAANIVVPADNKLTFTNSTERSSLARVTVTTAVGETVTAASTGAMKILDINTVGQIGSDFRAETTGGTDYTSASGSGTFSMVATTTSVVFYVFTTSTSAASLTVNKGGNTRIVWIKGLAGSAYNLTAVLPAVIPAASPTDANLILKVTDVFGNEFKAATRTFDTSITGAGGTLDPGAGSAVSHSYVAASGGYESKIFATGTGPLAVSFAIPGVTNVSGLATAKKSVFLTQTATDLTALNTQVTALTAQVAALTAQLANSRSKEESVTKKKYNSLVRAHRALGGTAKLKP